MTILSFKHLFPITNRPVGVWHSNVDTNSPDFFCSSFSNIFLSWYEQQCLSSKGTAGRFSSSTKKKINCNPYSSQRKELQSLHNYIFTTFNRKNCRSNATESLVAFWGCAVIGVSQGDERPLMSKFRYCGHIRSYKQRCVSNKLFLLGVQSFVYPTQALSAKEAINRKNQS